MAVEGIHGGASNSTYLSQATDATARKTLAQSIAEAKAEAQANISDGDETPGAAGTVDELA